MQRVTEWKKMGSSLKSTWIGLVLFGVLAGGVVLTGCGGGEEDEGGTGTNTAKDAGGGDE